MAQAIIDYIVWQLHGVFPNYLIQNSLQKGPFETAKLANDYEPFFFANTLARIFMQQFSCKACFPQKQRFLVSEPRINHANQGFSTKQCIMGSNWILTNENINENSKINQACIPREIGRKIFIANVFLLSRIIVSHCI